MARLAAVATADPPHRMRQEDAKGLAHAFFTKDDADLERVLTVFDNAGVRTRHIAQDPAWYLEPHGWKDRTRAFHDVGLDLLGTATDRVLDKAGNKRGDVDAVVLVTSTGISTPSLDARLANRLGLRPDLARVPLWGLGCGGGVAGLARAADLADARPGRRVLLLSLELCSLAFLRDRFDKKLLVAASLFGDGCAAVLVTSDDTAPPDAPRVAAAQSHQWPRTEWVMGWDVVDEGLDVVFDPKIPRFVRDEIRPPTERFLDGRDVDAYALHPGGAKVLDAFQTALDLPPGALDASREVLADHGNMSSPTVLYVLERVLARRPGRVLAAALGPGFSHEQALLEDGAA